MLQIVVLGESEALFMTAFGIESDKVTGNILDAFLSFLLESFPRSCSESGEAWRFSCVTAAILRNFVQGMNRHIYLVIALIDDAYHLVICITDGHA